LITVGCYGISTAQNVVFKTPEDAINYYFEGLAQADSNKILRACAINEMSEKFRFDLYTERLAVFMPLQSLSPTNYPLFIETNKTQLSAQILSRVKIFSYSLLSSEKVDEGDPILIDTERTNNFINAVDPKRLSLIKVQKIDRPHKTLMDNPKNLENEAKIASIYGADESTERVALFLFENNYYYLGFTLLRYGENWKISDQISQFAGTNPLGAPQKTTVDEFEILVNK